MATNKTFTATRHILSILTSRYGIIYCEHPDCLGMIHPGEKVFARSNGRIGKKGKYQRPLLRKYYHLECWEKLLI